MLVDEMTGRESVAMLTARLAVQPSDPAPFQRARRAAGGMAAAAGARGIAVARADGAR